MQLHVCFVLMLMIYNFDHKFPDTCSECNVGAAATAITVKNEIKQRTLDLGNEAI